MTGLAAWQAALTAAIESGRPHVSISGRLREVPGPSIEQGILVHRNSSCGARIRAQFDVYPVCLRRLGETCFGGLARTYADRFPSGDADLNRFGGTFAELLDEAVAGFPAFAECPWLADVARLEWLCHLLYYRDDDPPVADDILNSPDPSLLVRPANSVAWMHSDWPVHRIWEVHQRPGEIPTLQLERGEWFLMAERQTFRAVPRVVERGLWRLLDATAAHPSIAELADATDLEVHRLGELVRRRWIRLSAAADDPGQGSGSHRSNAFRAPAAKTFSRSRSTR